MAFEDIHFPVYRKYKNNSSFFKIVSRYYFEEIQVIGSRVALHKVNAAQLPEMNHIYDLVYDTEKNILEITENEYLEMFKKVK